MVLVLVVATETKFKKENKNKNKNDEEEIKILTVHLVPSSIRPSQFFSLFPSIDQCK